GEIWICAVILEVLQRILKKDVGDEDVLVAERVVIQPTVRVLVELMKPRQIVLHAIILSVAEETDAKVVVGIEQASEVRLERLNSRADRREIEVARLVRQPRLDERFLQCDP